MEGNTLGEGVLACFSVGAAATLRGNGSRIGAAAVFCLVGVGWIRTTETIFQAFVLASQLYSWYAKDTVDDSGWWRDNI